MINTPFTRIFLPGFLFMGVLIGGGYATGRELVEFFLTAGPLGGLLGMALATLLFSLITALSFELARITHSFSYRSFFRQLLGRGWFLYEIAYAALGLLVLAVIGAAAGEIVAQQVGLPAAVGTVALMAAIGTLVFFGTEVVEKVLGGWSVVLYGTYATFVICYLAEFGNELGSGLSASAVGLDAVAGGIRYVGYSIAVIPVILFCVAHMKSRRDAVLAGVLAGPIAMIPAFLFFLTMIATYPDVLAATVPVDFMMSRLDMAPMKLLFYIAIFGTFIQTGTGFLHAFNERISEAWHDKGGEMPRWLRPVVSVSALLISITLAGRFGIIDLIARGYGTLTWIFISLFLLPLLTVGIWRIVVSAPAQVPLSDQPQ